MRFFGMSEIGLVRKINQDSFCVTYNLNNDFIAIVCDGIGGGKAGDVASEMACDQMRNAFLKNPTLKSDEDVKTWLYETIRLTNDLIFSQSSSVKSQNGMGTTMVGILVTKHHSYVFNIGDSRAYAMYDDLICLTEDHNMLRDLIKAGKLSEKDAKTHPQRNVLTNALGIWNQVRVDIGRINDDYSQLLICSDGLHGYVSEPLIKKILLSESGMKEKVKNLIQASIQAGGYDNVSVILIDSKEGECHE